MRIKTGFCVIAVMTLALPPLEVKAKSENPSGMIKTMVFRSNFSGTSDISDTRSSASTHPLAHQKKPQKESTMISSSSSMEASSSTWRGWSFVKKMDKELDDHKKEALLKQLIKSPEDHDLAGWALAFELERAGHSWLLESCIKNGNVNAKNEEGLSLVQLATRQRQNAVVQRLLKAGALP